MTDKQTDKRVALMREQIADIVEEAIDSVHDMDVTHRDYANASADAIMTAFGMDETQE